ncbi:hypothetical protein [Shewanella mangrovisoli]|uniref:hypothetical protein n=1 Tax=Shewanella TaxID=22 RepID=UPI00313C837D
MKIQILVSTLNDGVKKIRFDSNFDYLVVHQISNGAEKIYSDYINSLSKTNKTAITYIQSNTIGLTISRNLCLLNASKDAEYFWIMDDDVQLQSDAYDRLCKLLNGNKGFDSYIVRHSDLKDVKILGDSYRHGFISSAKVASIDIVISNKIVQSGITFDENFGLGAIYPSGEEYIFMTDILKGSYKILQTNLVLTYHPPIASGLDFFSTPLKLVAKKMMFKRIFGVFWGNIFYLLFLFKKLPTFFQKSNRKYLVNIIKSFNY